jgi:hypothetical protein
LAWEESGILRCYPQFLDFLFDRPIVDDAKEYDLFRGGIDCFVASNPASAVAHVRTMCRNFLEVSKGYSYEELNQGLWAVFGAAISCEQYLFDSTVDLGLRLDCIESMYMPFRDVVAHSTMDKYGSFYFMWWDTILHTFWLSQISAQPFSVDTKQIHETMYQTLLKILALDNLACQWSALHGLGHLNHPLVRETVQNYLDAHRDKLTAEDVQWIEGCRDGRTI